MIFYQIHELFLKFFQVKYNELYTLLANMKINFTKINLLRYNQGV